jgi:beta-glucosidase
MLKRTLMLLAVLAAFAPAFAARAADSAVAERATTKPVPRDKEKWWTDRHEKVNEQAKKGEAQLLFLGDSITHGWEGNKELWEKYYGKYKPINAGFGGDRTQHVLWRLEHGEIDGIKPKLAVIMIGTNNAGSDKPEDTAEGVKAIVEKLHEKLPETKVLILAVFPRDAGPNDKNRKTNDAVNEHIKKLADDKQVFYLDIGPKFLSPEGTLSKDIMPDLLHPNAAGYKIWGDATESTIAKLMEK